MQRINDCPGSFNACLTINEEAIPSSIEADLGVQIHSAHETGNGSSLSEEGLQVWMSQKSEEQRLVSQIFGDEKVAIVREMSISWGDISGHIDCLVVGEEKALVMDYKTGRGDVTKAAQNLQLRTYAVLVSRHCKQSIKQIHVAIINRYGESDLVTYHPEDVSEAAEQISKIVSRAKDPSAPRYPSESACKYCPAAGTSCCPESKSLVNEIAVTPEVEVPSGQTIARRLELFAVCEGIIKKERAAYKALLKSNPEAIPGWTLNEGRKTRELDVKTACEILEKEGLAFPIDSAKFLITPFESAMKKATGKKGSNFIVWFNQVFGPAISEKQTEPSLQKKGQE
jgi:CRISPR/Cas system-associated exonuclease Cas4 (RecB family)